MANNLIAEVMLSIALRIPAQFVVMIPPIMFNIVIIDSPENVWGNIAAQTLSSLHRNISQLLWRPPVIAAH